MLVKNILAVFAVASLAAAAPAEDINARAVCPAAFCCKTVVPLNLFFIKGIGSGDCKKVATGSCTSGKKLLCCQSGHYIEDQKEGEVVCMP